MIVKFVFATTEVRKVPITVLSRCQRFDLRRVGTKQLADHFEKVANKEGIKIDEEASHLIARAADGSVRDGLSQPFSWPEPDDNNKKSEIPNPEDRLINSRMS